MLTSLDPGDFNAFCLPYILGLKTNLSYIVGGRVTIEEPQPGIGYSLKSHQFGTSDRILLVSEVRLYANNHTPTYHVVVGDIVGREKVGIVKKKLEAACSVDSPTNLIYRKNHPMTCIGCHEFGHYHSGLNSKDLFFRSVISAKQMMLAFFLSPKLRYS